MYNCVGMNKKELKSLELLNSKRKLFNEHNLDFFSEYKTSNYAMQILLLRKIKLLKSGTEHIGYSWITNQNRNVSLINSIYVDEDTNMFEGLKTLLDASKGKTTLDYFCSKNNENFNILEELGFNKKTGNFDMERFNDSIVKLDLDENLSFQVFERGVHEKLRSDLQNIIFKTSNRIPLTIADIYFDELQNYYYPKGSIFIKYRGKPIGYGQIILEDNQPTIVNFGIINNYRNHGFGKIFLYYLLNIIKADGYDSAYIRVKSDNFIALKLYSSLGFKIIKESYNFELKRR